MQLKGVIVYRIEGSNCLNGTFINNMSNNVLGNSIAKKLDNQDCIEGTYLCSYIDNSLHDCELRITTTDPNLKIYMFSWYNKGESKPFYEGIGMITNNKLISVSYWDK